MTNVVSAVIMLSVSYGKYGSDAGSIPEKSTFTWIWGHKVGNSSPRTWPLVLKDAM